MTQRYKEGFLSRGPFYSIMFIEDENRTKQIRRAERKLHKYGLCKTTGLMQQKSNKPLSDEESVRLAVPFIEKIWDSYLSKWMRNSNSDFTFTASWYLYDWQSLADSLSLDYSLAYGDYCGTRNLAVNDVCVSMLGIERRNLYYIALNRAFVSYGLFPTYSELLPGFELSWINELTIVTLDAPGESSDRALNVDNPTFTDVNEAINHLCKNNVNNEKSYYIENKK